MPMVIPRLDFFFKGSANDNSYISNLSREWDLIQL